MTVFQTESTELPRAEKCDPRNLGRAPVWQTMAAAREALGISCSGIDGTHLLGVAEPLALRASCREREACARLTALSLPADQHPTECATPARMRLVNLM